jgi:hypothetical protein
MAVNKPVRMKILIEHDRGGIFVKGADNWTTDPEEALRFPNSIMAMEFCSRHRLRRAKVLLKFSDGRFDIAFEARHFPWVVPAERPRHSVSNEPAR